MRAYAKALLRCKFNINYVFFIVTARSVSGNPDLPATWFFWIVLEGILSSGVRVWAESRLSPIRYYRDASTSTRTPPGLSGATPDLPEMSPVIIWVL